MISSLPSLISSGINFLQGERTSRSAIQANRESIAASKELARSQNEWNRNMWEEQNKYNSPAAQIQRLQEAGLNPAMMYKGSSAANTSAAAQPAAGYDTKRIGRKHTPLLFEMQDIRMREAQIGNLQATNANIMADTELKKTTGSQREAETILKQKQSQMSDAQRQQVNAMTEKVRQEIVNLKKMELNIKSQKELTDAQTKREQIANDLSEILKIYGLSPSDGAIIRALVVPKFRGGIKTFLDRIIDDFEIPRLNSPQSITPHYFNP